MGANPGTLTSRPRADSQNSTSSYLLVSDDESYSNQHVSSEQLSAANAQTSSKLPNNGFDFEDILNSSPNRQHARRLLCMLLAARRPLKLAEVQVVYALIIRPPDREGPKSYEDLQLVQDNDSFKRLLKQTCGAAVEFVKSYVHLREGLFDYLVAGAASGGGTDIACWEKSITLEHANRVCLDVCLDLMSFETDADVGIQLINGNAQGSFRDCVQSIVSARPFFQYAACNWHEHAVQAGSQAHEAFATRSVQKYFDVSQLQFWVWSLLAFEQVGMSKSIMCNKWHDEKVRAPVWDGSDRCDKGIFIRDLCLKKFGCMDEAVAALCCGDSNQTTDGSRWSDCVVWTAENGYYLIDQFHLANGDWTQISTSKAVQALESADDKSSAILTRYANVSSLIWTALRNGAPVALREALALTDSLGWLENIPEEMLAYQGKQSGLHEQYPATFDLMIRANALSCGNTLFSVVADWIRRLTALGQDYVPRLWEAGGFISPVLCRALVENGAQIDIALWSDQLTALQVAATFWEHATVKTLLELGADPMTSSASAWNTLHWFCFAQGGPVRGEKLELFPQRLKKANIVSSLDSIFAKATARDALMHQPGIDGISPLMLAIKAGTTLVKYLLDRGAEVDQTDCDGRTALMRFFRGDAWTNRRTTTLRALLAAGADAQLTDDQGKTALGYWAQALVSTNLSYLYPGANAYNNSFHALDTVGKLAASGQMPELLQPLHIPLAVAARLGNAKLCKYLLDAGADPNEHGMRTSLPRNDGSVASDLEDLVWNPLLLAVSEQANVTATLLLQYGANLHFKIPTLSRSWNFPKTGTTALHYVVSGVPKIGDRPCTVRPVELPSKLFAGCGFNLVGHPEQPVPTSSSYKMCQRLAGRSRSAQERRNKERLAYEDSDPEIETTRRSFANDSRGAELLPFDKLDSASIPAHPLSNEPVVNAIYSPDSTSEQRQRALTQLLLQLGADSDAQNQGGISPLIICGSSGRTDLAEILLSHGAATDLATSNGSTALMLAVRRGDVEMAKLLLEHNAAVDAQMTTPPPDKCSCSEFTGRFGHLNDHCDAPVTALALAVAWGHGDMVELLLDHHADPNLPISHHAHGKLESRKQRRRRERRYRRRESSDEDSEPDDETWGGFTAIATALTWAREDIRHLLLQRGARPDFEDALRPCNCEVVARSAQDDDRGSF